MSFVTHIWTQMGLGYIVKQIYDKPKVIWWDRINVGKTMMKDDFIKQQDIAYLDHKHKKGSWSLHKNLTIFVRTWAFDHSKDVFYFPNVGEVNGIKVTFTIEIQTPS
jgi:hypothetical protein